MVPFEVAICDLKSKSVVCAKFAHMIFQICTSKNQTEPVSNPYKLKPYSVPFL